MAKKKLGAKRKFHNRHVLLDGMLFHSEKESKHYLELKDKVRTGFVRNLRCQVSYPCEVNGQLVCTYIADFVYEKRVSGGWVEIVEDVKGYYGRAGAFAVFRLKVKLVKALYGVTVTATY